MSKSINITLLTGIIVGSVVLLYFTFSSKTPTTERLVLQMRGESCDFVDGGDTVSRHTFITRLSRRNDVEQCVIDAIRLLQKSHSKENDVVPFLIDAVKVLRNVDTGDGVIPVRGEAVRALGYIGDARAIGVLTEVLTSDDPVVLSSRATFPEGYEIKKGTTHEVARQAIERITSSISL